MSTTSNLIMTYRPRYAEHAPETWAAVADFVRNTVRPYTTGRTQEHALLALIAVAQYAYWLRFVGIDAVDSTVLRADLIETYSRSRGPAEVAPTTPARQRKLLLTLAGLHPPREVGRAASTVSTPLAPYDDAELSGIRDWARWQPNAISRLSAHGLVGLCLGCGLTRAELPHIRRDHVTRTATSYRVEVAGPRARRVPVDPAWSDILDYAVAHAADYLIAPLATRRTPLHVAGWFARAHGDAPFPSRMRNTWLLARMDEGLTADELVAAAGLSTIRSLERFIRTHAPQHRGLLHGARSPKR